MKSDTLTYPIRVTIHFQLRVAQRSFALRNLSEIFVQQPWTYANTVEPRFTTTPFIRPPRYYDRILSNQT